MPPGPSGVEWTQSLRPTQIDGHIVFVWRKARGKQERVAATTVWHTEVLADSRPFTAMRSRRDPIQSGGLNEGAAADSNVAG